MKAWASMGWAPLMYSLMRGLPRASLKGPAGDFDEATPIPAPSPAEKYM